MALRCILGAEWDPGRSENQCAYCHQTLNRANRSKEDFWPRWFQKKFPEQVGERSSHFRRDFRGEQTKPSGCSTLRHKVRMLCAKCNNGFGSQVHERAMPVIFKIMSTDFEGLSREELRTLSLWAAMFAMTFEFVDTRTKMMTQLTRLHFAERLETPPTMRIWLANYGGTGFQFNPQHLSLPHYATPFGSELVDGMENYLQRTSQVTTIALGPVILIVSALEDFNDRAAQPHSPPEKGDWAHLQEITNSRELWEKDDWQQVLDDQVQSLAIEALHLNYSKEQLQTLGELRRIEARPGIEHDFWRSLTNEPAWRY